MRTSANSGLVSASTSDSSISFMPQFEQKAPTFEGCVPWWAISRVKISRRVASRRYSISANYFFAAS